MPYRSYNDNRDSRGNGSKWITSILGALLGGGGPVQNASFSADALTNPGAVDPNVTLGEASLPYKEPGFSQRLFGNQRASELNDKYLSGVMENQRALDLQKGLESLKEVNLAKQGTAQLGVLDQLGQRADLPYDLSLEDPADIARSLQAKFGDTLSKGLANIPSDAMRSLSDRSAMLEAQAGVKAREHPMFQGATNYGVLDKLMPGITVPGAGFYDPKTGLRITPQAMKTETKNVPQVFTDAQGKPIYTLNKSEQIHSYTPPSISQERQPLGFIENPMPIPPPTSGGVPIGPRPANQPIPQSEYERYGFPVPQQQPVTPQQPQRTLDYDTLWKLLQQIGAVK